MYKVITANSKYLNRDLLSGFINFRKVTLKMKVRNDAETYSENLLFVYDLKDDNMIKEFADQINYSDYNAWVWKIYWVNIY